MPTYEFRCRDCRERYLTWAELGDNEPPDCPSCGIPTKRVFSFTPATVQHGGWDGNLGVEVRGAKHYADVLKAQSEAATARNGVEHNYIPVPLSDLKEMAGVTEEGMDSTNRAARTEGKTDSAMWL